MLKSFQKSEIKIQECQITSKRKMKTKLCEILPNCFKIILKPFGR